MVSAVIMDENEEELQYTLRILESTGMFDSIQGFSNPEAAYAAIMGKKLDILFLETELKNMNCFLFIDNIQKSRQDFFYVIMTRNKNYAFEALKKGATDYLLKPLTKAEVIKTLQKIERYLK